MDTTLSKSKRRLSPQRQSWCLGLRALQKSTRVVSLLRGSGLHALGTLSLTLFGVESDDSSPIPIQRPLASRGKRSSAYTTRHESPKTSYPRRRVVHIYSSREWTSLPIKSKSL